MNSRTEKCILVVLDGWGHREESTDNAIAAARTPHWDALWSDCPHSLLDASGSAVGLPDGQMGNSEVGHSTLGAGRVLWQSLARVDRAVTDGSLAANPELQALVRGVAERGQRLHLFGLLSDGGVHSHVRHLHALIRAIRQHGAPELVFHAILDGRDVPPRSAAAHIADTQAVLAEAGYGPIADITGRYWAMDRDNRWERTARAWALYADGQAEHLAATADKALEDAYQRGESDEFIAPTSVHPAPVADGDALLFANFRADRMRQIVSAFCPDSADQPVDFERSSRPRNLDILTLTEYQPGLPVRVAFAAEEVNQSFGEVLAEQGKSQLRIAETEKFAHVTYFFSCGHNRPFEGEQRALIASPKVATYDLEPQMSAVEITDRLEGEIESGDWHFALCNYANGDMVGHTGKMDATVQAVECLDSCLGRLQRAARAHGAHLLITADHGNCEQMLDRTEGQAHTAHTANPVPLVYSGPAPVQLVPTGGLADIAPTLLALMGLKAPAEMTGRSLLDD